MIRRHQMSFVLLLAVFALAVGFGVTATTLAVRLNRERLAAVAAREDEADARAAAEEVTAFLREMMAAARPQEAQGEEITVRQIVDQAVLRAEGSFATRPAVEAAIRQTLGETLHGLGRHADAQKQIERAIQILRRLHGGAHRETAWAALHLGHAHRGQGHLGEALQLYGEALPTYRDLPSEKPRLAAVLDSLASLHMERNDLSAAERYLLELRALRAELPDVKPADEVRDALLMSSLQFHRGDHAAAEKLLLGALDQARSALGDRDELTLAVLSNLAVALKQQGKPAEARPYLEECLATFRIVYGDNHARTLNAAGNLASLLQALREYPESEALYRDMLGQFREQGRMDDPVAIAGVNNLALMFLEQARYDEAEPLMIDAVERARRVFGPQHPKTAVTMVSLARAMAAGGSGSSIAEAQKMLEESLAILEAALPPGHPHIRKVRDQLIAISTETANPP
jgi:tetratricopeptide (TPR) repeat protein